MEKRPSWTHQLYARVSAGGGGTGGRGEHMPVASSGARLDGRVEWARSGAPMRAEEQRSDEPDHSPGCAGRRRRKHSSRRSRTSSCLFVRRGRTGAVGAAAVGGHRHRPRDRRPADPENLPEAAPKGLPRRLHRLGQRTSQDGRASTLDSRSISGHALHTDGSDAMPHAQQVLSATAAS
jgi:hypothetical protein